VTETERDQKLAKLEDRVESIEATLAQCRDAYLKFMGGTGRRLLRMLGADTTGWPQ
jgi:hypothetical protein